jgi:hypothetical protein
VVVVGRGLVVAAGVSTDRTNANPTLIYL